MGFFKLGDAFNELTSAIGAKDTALAGAKLVGKTLFNTGKLAVDVAVKGVEMQSGKMLKRNDLTDEQRERLEETHTKFSEVRVNGEIKKLNSLIDTKKKEIESKISDNETSLDNKITQKKRKEIEKENDSLNYALKSIDNELSLIDDMEDLSLEDKKNRLERILNN
jgi:Spy/CpxP family protein refolding chaperone